MAQAEAEVQGFHLFYPAMEEAADVARKDLPDHFPADGKGDRDPNNELRAEQECRPTFEQFPNFESRGRCREQRHLREIPGSAGRSRISGWPFQAKKDPMKRRDRFDRAGWTIVLVSKADYRVEGGDFVLSHGPPVSNLKEGRRRAGEAGEDYRSARLPIRRKKETPNVEMPVPEAGTPRTVARIGYFFERRIAPMTGNG